MDVRCHCTTTRSRVDTGWMDSIIHVMKNAKTDILQDSPECLVRNYMLDNNLAPGDRLPRHEEMCEILGVGSRRLREGLKVLQHQGLIETRSKAGTIVCEPAVEKLAGPVGWHFDATGCSRRDLLGARACLEGASAWEAARCRSARDLLVIFDAVEQLEARDAEAQLDIDEEEAFHLAILCATGNPVMRTFGQLISLQIRRSAGELPLPPDRQTANREHRTIYDAIHRRDAPAAMQSMYDHVTRQRDFVDTCPENGPAGQPISLC